MKKKVALITLPEVAKLLGVSHRRVSALITAKRLPAQRFGPIWLVDPKHLDLDIIKNRRPGKPRKIKVKE